MHIPFDFTNISLWLAVTSIILLITVLIASAYDGKATIMINQKRLGNVAIVMGILFMVTVAIRIYEIVVSA